MRTQLSKRIEAYSAKLDRWVEYERPNRREAIAHAEATWGSQYDPVERQVVTGCLPMVWVRRDSRSVDRNVSL